MTESSCETEDPQAAVISLFDLLPPEIAEIPIKMAMRADWRGEQKFLVDVISKVSSQFQALATSKSLWQGHVHTQGDNEEKMHEVIQKFLNEGTTSLIIHGTKTIPSISANEFTMMAKTSKVKHLIIEHWIKITSWPDPRPDLASPWTSLEHLVLWYVELEHNMFFGVRLHRSVPNLRSLVLYPHTNLLSPANILPDMQKCIFLEELTLYHAKFVVTRGVLPQGLKKMDGNANITNVTKASLEEHFHECKISDTLIFSPH